MTLIDFQDTHPAKLILGVSKISTGMLVDIGDVPAVLAHENAERGLVENELGGAQRFMDALFFRDVLEKGHGVMTALEFNQRGGHFDREKRAILPALPALERTGADIAQLSPRARPPFPIQVGIDVEDRHSHEFFQRKAEGLAGVAIGVKDAPVLVQPYGADRSVIQAKFGQPGVLVVVEDEVSLDAFHVALLIFA